MGMSHFDRSDCVFKNLADRVCSVGRFEGSRNEDSRTLHYKFCELQLSTLFQRPKGGCWLNLEILGFQNTFLFKVGRG